MVAFLQLDILTNLERHEATERARTALMQSGASITDARQFSNKALVLTFETSVDALAGLLAALQSSALEPAPKGVERAAAIANEHPTDGMVVGTLFLGFSHDEPDLSIETPHVPG